ncbi:MAG TPA: SDR family NAD(P)-dependent oxidoreductase [Acidimicrobiales bacterium]|nr:SDR family NAD(P)-dependent oxidoreductase [Acidimicrobiales bacterium]
MPDGPTGNGSMSLEGTRAVVTGATSGLGRAMAHALAAAGSQVGVTSRSRERAEATARQLGPQVAGLGLDVRDEQSVAVFVDEVRARLGGIDMLVNNAGIGMRTVNARFPAYAQPFWEVSASGFRDVFETKVTGVNDAEGVHDERIVARDFGDWLAQRASLGA